MRTGTSPHHATSCGFCRQRVPKGHECEQKRAAMAPRKCPLSSCGIEFVPKVFLQAYCCTAHKRAADYERAKERGGTKQRGAVEERYASALERKYEAAAEQARAYVPMMGEALRLATVRLMGGKG
jgi:hypothetical protein